MEVGRAMDPEEPREAAAGSGPLMDNLRRNPELRSAVWRELLTDELLALPQTVHEHSGSMTQLKATVGEHGKDLIFLTSTLRTVIELVGDQNQDIDSLKSSLAALKDALDAADRDLSRSRQDLDAARDDTQSARQGLEATHSALAAARSDLEATRVELAETRGQLNAARAEMAALALKVVALTPAPEPGRRGWFRRSRAQPAPPASPA